MSNQLLARIPEGITYVFRAPRDVAIGWDDIEETGTMARVDPAFPTETGNAKTLATAQQWACGYGCEAEASTCAVANAPIAKITIVNLELRDEGGRAYKAALPTIEGRTPYVDLREDVFLDAMLTNGVAPGGVLDGPFIWARVGSQMKLIRVGSVLHRHVVEADERGRRKVVASTDLVRGGVYANKKGDLFVYLGQCDTDELVYEKKRADYYGRREDTFTVTHKAHRNVQAWFELLSYEFDKAQPKTAQLQKVFDTALRTWDRTYGPSYWSFSVVKKKSAIEQVGAVELPANLWEPIRAMGAAATAHRLDSNSTARNYATQHWDEYRKQHEAAHPDACAGHAVLRLVRDVGAGRPHVADFERWLPVGTLPYAAKVTDLEARFVPGGLYESATGQQYVCFGPCVTNEIVTMQEPGPGFCSLVYTSVCGDDLRTVAWLELDRRADEVPEAAMQRILSDPGSHTASHCVKFGVWDYSLKRVMATFSGAQWETLRATATAAAEWSKRHPPTRHRKGALPSGGVDPEFLASISRVAYVRAYGTTRPAVPEFDLLLAAPLTL